VPSGATTYNSGTGVWHIGGLANGANATLSIVATVNTTAPITNTANKTAEDQPDSTAGNNSASASITPVAADLAITKTVDNPTPNLFSNVTFTVTATNNGPSAATGVQVTDLLPAGLIYVSSTPSQGAYNSGTGFWNVGALANGANANLSIVATVTSLSDSVNTATKTAEDQVDPNTSKDSASSRVACCLADVAVAKTVDNPTPGFGSNVTYTVTATNNGPRDASGLQLTDQLPAGLTFVSATPSVGTYNSGTGVWNIGALTNGSNATLAITATVNTLVPTTNTATKTAENEADNTAGDDSAGATITPVAADIATTKTVSNTVPNQNSNVTFTVTASNNGPSNASGVQVTDLLPAGLSYISSTPSQGAYNSGTGVWNIGALANGANATLSITATVTGTNPVTNTATKTAEDQPDPVPGNNSAMATVTGQAADIALIKTVSSPTVALGSNAVFVVTATNNGPSSATGVVVTDLLPAGLVLVSATPSGGTTYNSGTGVWSIGGLANGASATLSIVATVNTTSATTNTATKIAEDQTDPVAGNDSASATLTGLSADIAVTKQVNNLAPQVSQNVTYTLVAHNLGPSAAPGVQLHDLLPAGLQFLSYTATQGTYSSVTGAWNVGNMVNGATVTLVVVAKVTSSGTFVNTVTTVAGGYLDPNLTNNTASASIVALPGMPNTSAPDGDAGPQGQAAPQPSPGLLLVILIAVAYLGALSLAGVGRGRRRATSGRRRSRSRPSQGRGRLAFGLIAILISLGLASMSVGERPSYATPAVAALPAGTQLIGGKAVAVAPPAAPAPPVADTFHQATGPITPSRLRIPSIGVDAWVGAVGLRRDGSMDIPNNLWTSSWLATGPRPGGAGKAVIAGHRGVGSPALFSHLENMRPGDRILVSDASGAEVVYEVTRVASLDLSATTQLEVFGPTTAQELELITCFGRYVDSARTYDHRLVVFSRPVPPT
jgi:LPXTG-site transpeptidase (sortase) family protein